MPAYTVWRIKKVDTTEYLDEAIGSLDDISAESASAFLCCDPGSVAINDLHVPLYEHPGCHGGAFGLLTYTKLSDSYRVQEVYQDSKWGLCARDDGLFVLPSNDPYATPGARVALFQSRWKRVECRRIEEVVW